MFLRVNRDRVCVEGTGNASDGMDISLMVNIIYNVGMRLRYKLKIQRT